MSAKGSLVALAAVAIAAAQEKKQVTPALVFSFDGTGARADSLPACIRNLR